MTEFHSSLTGRKCERATLSVPEHGNPISCNGVVLEKVCEENARWQCDTERLLARAARSPWLPAEKTCADGKAKIIPFVPRSKIWLLSQEFSPSLPPTPLPSFPSLALPVFPMAFHSSSWMYFLLFWQVWQVWNIKLYEWLPLLQLITLRITW